MPNGPDRWRHYTIHLYRCISKSDEQLSVESYFCFKGDASVMLMLTSMPSYQCHGAGNDKGIIPVMLLALSGKHYCSFVWIFIACLYEYRLYTLYMNTWVPCGHSFNSSKHRTILVTWLYTLLSATYTIYSIPGITILVYTILSFL